VWSQGAIECRIKCVDFRVRNLEDFEKGKYKVLEAILGHSTTKYHRAIQSHPKGGTSILLEKVNGKKKKKFLLWSANILPLTKFHIFNNFTSSTHLIKNKFNIVIRKGFLQWTIKPFTINHSTTSTC